MEHGRVKVAIVARTNADAERTNWIDLVSDALEWVKEPYRTNLEDWIRSRIRSQMNGGVFDADPLLALRELDAQDSREMVWPLESVILRVVARTVQIFGYGTRMERKRVADSLEVVWKRDMWKRGNGNRKFSQY